MIERILGCFRYVKDLQLELRELRHNETLYRKLIESKTAERDVLQTYIAELKADKARLEIAETERQKASSISVAKLIELIGIRKGR